MKKLFTLFCVSLSLMPRAQVVFDFATAGPTSGVQPNSTVSAVAQGNNNGTTALITAVSLSNTYPGFSGGNNAGAAARTGAINTAANGTAYFEVTFTPSTGYQITLSAISSGSRSTTTGPQLLIVRTSLDGFVSDASTATVSNTSAWALAPFSALNVAGGNDIAITLRIYGSAGTGTPTAGAANWRIDDLKITYTSNPFVVPVTLSTFTGSYTNKTSVLNWAVGAESNINGYAVERSNDGRNFSQIGYVNATGAAQYSFTDNTFKSNINFYRLKIEGNQIKYSSVVKILSDAFRGKLNVYPSPAVNNLNAEFVSDDNQIANIKMADITGKTLLQKTITVQKGYNNLNLDVSVLNKGIYILKILIGNKIITTPFNKL